jgi:hypothetical protein
MLSENKSAWIKSQKVTLWFTIILQLFTFNTKHAIIDNAGKVYSMINNTGLEQLHGGWMFSDAKRMV